MRTSTTFGALLAVAAVIRAGSLQAQTCTRTLDAVRIENAKQVPNPSVNTQDLPPWYTPTNLSVALRGFTTEVSYDKTETVIFKVEAPGPFSIVIYRLGFYTGQLTADDPGGARAVDRRDWSIPIPAQLACASIVTPPCMTKIPEVRGDCPANEPVDHPLPYYASQRFIECASWAQTWLWQPPPDTVSGLFMAQLVLSADHTQVSKIFFVIRDDACPSDILFQTSDTTWQAYGMGPQWTDGPLPRDGHSLYTDGNGYESAYKVSQWRPLDAQINFGGTEYLVLDTEYPVIRFLEKQGYDVSYFTGRDADQRGALIGNPNHKIYMTAGHDEYWSTAQRNAIQTARDSGVNLAFLTGNTAYWHIRWENDHHTMVCYKEGAQEDRAGHWSPDLWRLDPSVTETTGLFRDQAIAAYDSSPFPPENAVIGQLSPKGGIPVKKLVVPVADGQLRFWRNTPIAALGPWETFVSSADLLGLEIDGDIDNGFRPRGLSWLSSTAIDNLDGSFWEKGRASLDHHFTFYRAPNGGGRVFSAGTWRLGWALSGFHCVAGPCVYEQNVPTRFGVDGTAVDANIRQAIVNLLADMGAQPQTPVGITPATASADQSPPNISIGYPPPNATLRSLETVAIAGTATDSVGRVAAVEVSTDDGATWHPAVGREYWHYDFTPCAEGGDTSSFTLFARAVDDSGNLASSPPVAYRVAADGSQTFVRNRNFNCGFVGLDDPNGKGSLAMSWAVHRTFPVPVTVPVALADGGQIGTVHSQRVTALATGDGVYQDISLQPGKTYTLRARVYVESPLSSGPFSTVVLSAGPAGAAPSATRTTTRVGAWETLVLNYSPTQAASTISVYASGELDTCLVGSVSHSCAVFKVDEVSIAENLDSNGGMDAGFEAVNNGAATGMKAVQWTAVSDSGHAATYSVGGTNSMQHVQLPTSSTSGSYADGLVQTVSVLPGHGYRATARVWVTSGGSVTLRAGRPGLPSDVIVGNRAPGTWETLTLDYYVAGSQTTLSLGFLGGVAGTEFWLDDIELTPTGP
jgi:N,N-dimethylformamidase beta subunit-like, C-terminal/Bacterial Ig domain